MSTNFCTFHGLKEFLFIFQEFWGTARTRCLVGKWTEFTWKRYGRFSGNKSKNLVNLKCLLEPIWSFINLTLVTSHTAKPQITWIIDNTWYATDLDNKAPLVIRFMLKVKWYSSSCTHLRATGHHLLYGITQCYLPPYTGERAPPNPSQKGWYLIYLPRRDGRLSWHRVQDNQRNSYHNEKAALSQGNHTMQRVFACIQWLINCYLHSLYKRRRKCETVNSGCYGHKLHVIYPIPYSGQNFEVFPLELDP